MDNNYRAETTTLIGKGVYIHIFNFSQQISFQIDEFELKKVFIGQSTSIWIYIHPFSSINGLVTGLNNYKDFLCYLY